MKGRKSHDTNSYTYMYVETDETGMVSIDDDGD